MLRYLSLLVAQGCAHAVPSAAPAAPCDPSVVSALALGPEHVTALGVHFPAPAGWQISLVDPAHARIAAPGSAARFEVYTVSACGTDTLASLVDRSIGDWAGLSAAEVRAQLTSAPTGRVGLGGQVGVGGMMEGATVTVAGQPVVFDATFSEVAHSADTKLVTVALCPHDDPCGAAYWAMLEQATPTP